jgi:hypothetical protein
VSARRIKALTTLALGCALGCALAGAGARAASADDAARRKGTSDKFTTAASEAFRDALADAAVGEGISYGEDWLGAAGAAAGWWLDLSTH